MAGPVNKIGIQKFLTLLGQVQRPYMRSSIDQRPGVNGTGFTLDGQMGEPFTLRSQVDQASIEDAQVTVITATSLCGAQTLVSITQDDYDFTSEQLKFKVLRVSLVRLHALAVSGDGGLNPPSEAWLELDWELLAVSTAPPPSDDEDD